MESPFVGGVLIVVSSRDEEPSASSPLTYRERCYYAREHVARERLEALLREELEKVRATLSGRARGQFVNLAVFDHHFQGKPQKKPIATLQWKDWRGDPVFALGDESNAPVWTSTSEPPRTSFVPDARPSSPAAPAPRTAPVSALYTPARAVVPAPEEPRATGFAREGTGDQDRRLAVAFEAVQDLYFLGTPLDGLEFAVKLLTDLVPCEAVSGGLYDINTDEFRFVAVTGPGATERRAQAVPLSAAGLLGAAVRSGEEVFLVAEAGADARFDAMADGRAGLLPRNILYLPLHKAENLLGVLQLINRENPRGFSEGDKAVSSYVAKQVADFLQSRRQVGPRRR